MKKYSKLLLVVLAAVLVLSACAQDKTPAVFATVNGVEITREQFEFYLSLEQLDDPSVQWTKEEKLARLEQLIEEQILLQEAQRQEIELDEEKVEKDFAAFRKQMITFFGSETAYITRLQEVKVTEAQLKNLISEYQLINNLIDVERAKAVQPDADEIKLFYDTHKDVYFKHKERRDVRHILITKDNFPDAEEDDDVDAMMEELADELYERLKNGESFITLAKEYSQDTSAVIGGNIGMIEKDDPYIVQQFRDKAFLLELNEVSEPVETMFGLHIIEVLEIQEAGYYPLDDDIALSIQEHLFEEKKRKLQEDLIKEIIENAEVVRNFK